jgi:hypothetical protein
MHRYHLHIGAIHFSIASSTTIDCIERSRFLAYATDEIEPDVSVHIIGVDEPPLHHRRLTIEERTELTGGFAFPIDRFEVPSWESPLLHDEQVRQRLRDSSDHKSLVNLEIRMNSVTITDFFKHEIFLYFAQGVEENVVAGRIDPHIFSCFIYDFDALMIHCSVVDWSGRAAVFLATDEGGKTTAARLCAGGTVLADDQIVFRRKDDRWFAHGTPWTTFPPEPGPSIPGAFFLLEKADSFSLTRLQSRDLLSFLWDEQYTQRFHIPKAHQTRLFDLYRDLISFAPVYRMCFPVDRVDTKAVLGCLGR